MPIRQDALEDRRFWAALNCCAYGQIGERPKPTAICAAVGVEEKEALRWCRTFAGPFVDERDGQSDDPAAIIVQLANDIRLRFEMHPGDQYWFLEDETTTATLLANVGPHWRIPGLRWTEAHAIAAAAPEHGCLALLIFLPIVWLTSDDDSQAAQAVVSAAWLDSRLVDRSSASALAAMWAAAVANGRKYPWRQNQSGEWVSTAGWSCRSDKATDAQLLGRLVTAAQDRGDL